MTSQPPPEATSEGDEFAFLAALSVEELECIAASDDMLQQQLHRAPSVRSAHAFLAELHQGNRELAEKTLAKEAELARIRTRIAGMQAAYWETRRELATLDERRLDAAKRFSANALLKQLRSLATQADIASDDRWEQFLASATAAPSDSAVVEAFVNDYTPLRSEYHLRTAHADRLSLGDESWRP
ncbi:hypothetical protein THASP1DRAFT_30864 [Thamnocephalis sphaerospora]|uniref:VPS37 C-terminal domain-containing protein n=1 Tax=Thamnocephalis sphaerospora TaxID=78915 RepID=A0A4P9XN20_9FUNG|nr:hypothetical protein THASP1DRAFT_30864 [Thamnocephalis sphaerospora]|eukprot:RKP07318.1 hypothetical protein THASP1DRAFT_30864 [Thamnocephalis sphaerospora]